jgi:methyltransferase (TIGR00027 family)
MAIESAEVVAALRATNARCADPDVRCQDIYAHHFLGGRYRLLAQSLPWWISRRLIEARSPGSLFFSLIRTKEFDNALLEEFRRGAPQIVLLGAGYDTRALRFADTIGSRPVFEVDHPSTQQRKLACLAGSGLTVPSNVRFVPVDLTAAGDSFDVALGRASFDATQQTLFLWEGVSYYLPEASVRKVFAFVRSCASGSAIVFDYSIATFVAGDHSSTFGGAQVARWLEKIGEPFRFGLDPSQTAGFLSSHGLTLERDVGPEALEGIHLTRRGRRLGRTLGHVRIATARAV